MTVAERIAKMKASKLSEIPKCSFCTKPATVDGPTLSGQWAYMCNDCVIDRADIIAVVAIGTRLTKHVSPPPQTDISTYPAKELYTLEEIAMGEDRVLECPKCGEEHRMEQDASGVFECHGCRRTLSMESLI